MDWKPACVGFSKRVEIARIIAGNIYQKGEGEIIIFSIAQLKTREVNGKEKKFLWKKKQ